MLQPLFFIIERRRNNEYRRKIQHEINRYMRNLLEIEQEFLIELFEDNDMSYSEIYQRYLDRFRARMDHIRKKGKLRYSMPNDDYFITKYQPKELV